MICDSCIYKEVCYEKEEDRRALKFCSEYFNLEDELDKIKAEIAEQKQDHCFDEDDMFVYITGLNNAIDIIDKYKNELKGEQNDNK